MEVKNIANLSDCCVRFADGSIDKEETLRLMAEQVMALEHRESGVQDRVRGAVESLFDRKLGQSIVMKNFGSIVAASLAIEPEDYDLVIDAANQYVRSNSEYKITKGPGGGVKRLRDQPKKEEN